MPVSEGDHGRDSKGNVRPCSATAQLQGKPLLLAAVLWALPQTAEKVLLDSDRFLTACSCLRSRSTSGASLHLGSVHRGLCCGSNDADAGQVQLSMHLLIKTAI
jgi:hypothetical protein